MAKTNIFSRRWNEIGVFDFKIEEKKSNYDDILDKSCFRPNSENVRQASLSGAGGKTGVYDDSDNLPSDLMVKIRSGKLDRAEIAQEIEKAKNKALSDVDEFEKADALKKADEISKARQDYLDSRTGFNPSGQQNG